MSFLANLVALIVLHGTQVATAVNLVPGAIKFVEAIAPLVQSLMPSSGSFIDKINGVLRAIGHPNMTPEEAKAAEKMWMDRASKAENTGKNAGNSSIP